MNEKIYYFLKDLNLRDIDIARYLSDKTGRTVRTWQVKLSNGVAVNQYESNGKAIKEFEKYGAMMLKEEYSKVTECCNEINKFFTKYEEKI